MALAGDGTQVETERQLLADGEPVGPGSSAILPAGEVMHHEPNGHHCLLVTIFDGPCDAPPAGACLID